MRRLQRLVALLAFASLLEDVSASRIMTLKRMKMFRDVDGPLPPQGSDSDWKERRINRSHTCGISSVTGISSRITRGNEAIPHRYPWLSTLFLKRGSHKSLCGGTLLNHKWILTAGHCLHGMEVVNIFLGAHNISSSYEEGRLSVKPKRYFAHPKYDPEILLNDVGLIELEESVTFSDTIFPICLPSYSEVEETFSNIDVNAAGWGFPSDDLHEYSPVLRDLDTQTISNSKCKAVLGVITQNNICISGKDGHSTCLGDSGGPLHIIMDDGRYKQIAITSFGVNLGCEKGYPAAFTRTTAYLKFIETETGIPIDE